MTIPKLNADKTECKIGEVTLRANQTIDYKTATENSISIGRILQFKYAGYQQSDTESVWMNVADMGERAATEWVSVVTWHNQHQAGLFTTKPKQEAENASAEPTDDSQFEF